ncbi:transporter [Sulfurivermis fontis]|jgi:hypothetical protein|uniref:transporter n=1 Tax=Sulfurivermis fontis TaxID=1972068 RepID=UPI000FD98646|nr:transporter [Sulfurivermis fontis]
MTGLNRKKTLVALLALAMAPLAQADSGYSVSVGGEYTRGDYGTGSNVSLLSLPVKLEYVDERYAWSIGVPYLWVSGPGDVVVSGSGMGRLSPTNTRTTSRTDSGVGDITASATLRLWEEGPRRPWAALTAKVKFGTADEASRLGTGENDYALQLELARQAVYGHVGYKVLGDPAGIEYDNIWYGGVGVDFPVGREVDGGVELYAEQEALSGIDGKRELTFYLGQQMERATRITGHLMMGLSDASPDWGAGVTLRFDL